MITDLDKNTALVLIDLQKGILKGKPASQINGVLENSSLLIDAFRKVNLPIVVVNVKPSGSSWIKSRKDSPSVISAATMPDFAEIVDEIATMPSDIFITKGTWNAFYNTPLHEKFQKRNITGIVMAGVSTSAGVEGTARAASEFGYNISFAIDAMTDTNAEAHQNSIRNIFPRLGEVGSTSDIISKLPNRK